MLPAWLQSRLTIFAHPDDDLLRERFWRSKVRSFFYRDRPRFGLPYKLHKLEMRLLLARRAFEERFYGSCLSSSCSYMEEQCKDIYDRLHKLSDEITRPKLDAAYEEALPFEVSRQDGTLSACPKLDVLQRYFEYVVEDTKEFWWERGRKAFGAIISSSVVAALITGALTFYATKQTPIKASIPAEQVQMRGFSITDVNTRFDVAIKKLYDNLYSNQYEEKLEEAKNKAVEGNFDAASLLLKELGDVPDKLENINADPDDLKKQKVKFDETILSLRRYCEDVADQKH